MNNLENIRLAVLASILTANEFGDIDLNVVMSSGITKEWFEAHEHQAMFEVMEVCYSGDIAFDDSTILSYMKKAGVENAPDTLLGVMAQKQVPQSILMEYLSLLKEAYKKKMLIELNNEITNLLRDENSSSDAIAQIIQNQLDGHLSLSKSASTKRLSEARKLRKSLPPVERLRTNIPFIDTVLTDKHGNVGIRNEGLTFISGLKQSGKTFVITRMIENISKHSPVLFGSLEFGRDLYDENVEEQQNENYFDGNTENIFVFDDIYEINAVIAEIRLQHKLHGIKIAFIDSMLRLTNNNPNLKTDERRLSEIFSKLGKLSKELKIPIVIIVQSSKEDLKSSMVSVKGCLDADHEAFTWFHITKTKPKEPEDEMRTVLWVKNKDTHKHPKQHLMFVPQTSDFYRVEIDEHGNAAKALDKYRRPKASAIVTTYETIPKDSQAHDSDSMSMPQF